MIIKHYTLFKIKNQFVFYDTNKIYKINTYHKSINLFRIHKGGTSKPRYTVIESVSTPILYHAHISKKYYYNSKTAYKKLFSNIYYNHKQLQTIK